MNGAYPDEEGDMEREDIGGVLDTLLSFCSTQPDRNDSERDRNIRSILTLTRNNVLKFLSIFVRMRIWSNPNIFFF